MTSFASQLRRIRKERGLTQEQLAASLHVTRQTISNWENDRAQPDYEMLATLAQVLNVPLSTLLEDGSPVPAAQESAVQTHTPRPEETPLTESSETEEAQTETAPQEDVPQQDAQREPLSSGASLPAVEFVASPKRLPKARAVLAAVLLFFAVTAILLLSAGGTDEVLFPLSHFTTERPKTEGAPFLEIYTREESARFKQARPEAVPQWDVRFFLRETGGEALDVTLLTTVLFYKDGSQLVFAADEKQFINSLGHPHFAPGELKVYPFQGDADPGIAGVGLEVQAADGSGRELCFTFYQPLEYVSR